MSRDDYMVEDLYDEEDEDTLSNRYLTFCLADEAFGVEIRYVTEIVGIQRITEVPDMPAYVKGVMNLRGQVIPVMDMRMRFKLDPIDYDERTCVIVIHLESMFVGLIVDRVQEVREIREEDVASPPRITNSLQSKFILGMGKVDDEVKILLDVSKLLKPEELEALKPE